jgi:hypothetical protein
VALFEPRHMLANNESHPKLKTKHRKGLGTIPFVVVYRGVPVFVSPEVVSVHYCNDTRISQL